MSEHAVVLKPAVQPVVRMGAGTIQRACACGSHAGGGECESCQKKKLQKRADGASPAEAAVSPIVAQVIASQGRPLECEVRGFMESRFGRDFSHVRLHTDGRAARSARSVGALAYTVDAHVVFAAGQHAPATSEGRQLIAHELTHVAQQGQAPPLAHLAASGDDRFVGGGNAEHQAETMAAAVMAGPAIGVPMYASAGVQKRAAPYIKKVTVHLTPPQSAELDWVGTPPAGNDSFTVSTGKGYSDPGDDPGTCTRDCCKDALKQCAPPWNEADRVGACCTYFGDTFWTGTPLEKHNGWNWWTPIQPYYSSRGIALHQHPDVTGQPIGHGCVRMAEENAKRIFDFSNGSKTNVTIDGRAAPVLCEDDRTCAGAKKSSTTSPDSTSLEPTGQLEAVPGLEGRAS